MRTRGGGRQTQSNKDEKPKETQTKKLTQRKLIKSSDEETMVCSTRMNLKDRPKKTDEKQVNSKSNLKKVQVPKKLKVGGRRKNQLSTSDSDIEKVNEGKRVKLTRKVQLKKVAEEAAKKAMEESKTDNMIKLNLDEKPHSSSGVEVFDFDDFRPEDDIDIEEKPKTRKRGPKRAAAANKTRAKSRSAHQSRKNLRSLRKWLGSTNLADNSSATKVTPIEKIPQANEKLNYSLVSNSPLTSDSENDNISLAKLKETTVPSTQQSRHSDFNKKLISFKALSASLAQSDDSMEPFTSVKPSLQKSELSNESLEISLEEAKSKVNSLAPFEAHNSSLALSSKSIANTSLTPSEPVDIVPLEELGKESCVSVNDAASGLDESDEQEQVLETNILVATPMRQYAAASNKNLNITSPQCKSTPAVESKNKNTNNNIENMFGFDRFLKEDPAEETDASNFSPILLRRARRSGRVNKILAERKNKKIEAELFDTPPTTQPQDQQINLFDDQDYEWNVVDSQLELHDNKDDGESDEDDHRPHQHHDKKKHQPPLPVPNISFDEYLQHPLTIETVYNGAKGS